MKVVNKDDNTPSRILRILWLYLEWHHLWLLFSKQ